MHRKLLPLSLAVFVAATAHAAPHARPKITGISHLAVYTSDAKATEAYYVGNIGAVRIPDPEDPKGVRYALSATQFVEVLPLPTNVGGSSVNRLDHSAWNTDNAEGMRLYLAEKGWKTPAKVTRNSDGSKSFRVLDPEQNAVEFVQPAASAKAPAATKAIGHHIIHIGFMVHSRSAEDKFYADLLGFRPYWFGGMVENRVDWVSKQTPDSHDWLEYMLTSGQNDMSTSGIPPTMTQQALGVLDHLSIGVASVPESYKKLAAENRLASSGGMAHTDKHTQIGRDGKYQFNLYDPDGIRLELMEFHATEKPCCSPFTADDPAE